MTSKEEKAYIEGRKSAYRSLLGECARELDGDELKLAGALSQLNDIRVSLRRVCEEFGDNDWPDNLHLGDVIDKHLANHLRGKKTKNVPHNPRPPKYI